MNASKPLYSVLCAAMILGPLRSHAAEAGQEIGYIERFALAPDRAKALEELIPGTDDYYYYTCLHLEQIKNWDEQALLLAQWDQRNTGHAQRQEIKNRRALLRYDQDPEGTLIYLRQNLNLQFNHEQERRDQAPDLPVALDQTLISHESFLREALNQRSDLEGFSETGLYYLLSQNYQITRQQQRDLLRRLEWPDDPKLVDIIAADLATPESGGFGEFTIHTKLTEAQLITLAEKHPDVLQDADYLRERLLRLRPNDDVNWRVDLAARQAYLERVWAFVEKLDPSLNSLKVHVLYHLLDTKRRQGVYDRTLFLTYLKLPRNAGYVEPTYLRKREFQGLAAELAVDYAVMTTFDAIGNDEGLVRDYLAEFIREEENVTRYQGLLREKFLNNLWAEAMLLAGKGDAQKWFSILGPSAVQQLRDRVDLSLRPSNPSETPVAAEVKLTADVKNVPQLLVKIYEVNTLNYYTKNLEEIDTAINLDGLVPNLERTFTYAEAGVLSVRRTFDLPELTGKRGVWVIEFIGGGKSSRALIRKGSYQVLQKVTAAGHAFRILDETNQPVEDGGAIWLGGRRYAAGENSLVVLPFSNDAGTKRIVLEAGGVASLSQFDHQDEVYKLSAGIFVDREQLLPKRRAKAVVKPILTINGQPAPLSLLQEVALEIHTLTLDDVESTDRIPDFKLDPKAESIHEFSVPDRLASLHISLTAKVDQLSKGGEKLELSDSRELQVSQINQTEFTRGLTLTRFQSDWVVELIGKNGEPIADAPLNCYFTHVGIPAIQRHAALKTNEAGRAILGALEGIDLVRVETPTTTAGAWRLPEELLRRPNIVTAAAGETVRIAYSGRAAQPQRSEVALFALRGEVLYQDLFDKLKLQDGAYVIAGLEPGDYYLHSRLDLQTIRVRVSGGAAREGFVLGKDRHLERNALPTVSVVSAGVNGEDLTLKLAGAGDLTRVHVMADRFQPEFSAYLYLHSFLEAQPETIVRGKFLNSYVSGRTLGEEHRYILDRRSNVRRPGNLLERPGLLLNPWELRSTETALQQAQSGDAYERKREGQMPGNAPTDSDALAVVIDPHMASFNDFSYLASQSTVLTNLKPDANGVITVPLAQFGDRNWVRILVTDPVQAIQKDVFLGDRQTRIQDLRLAKALDPQGLFAQKKQTTTLDKGGKLDLGSTDFRIFDDTGDLHALFNTLGGDPEKLGEFAFILKWSTFDEKAKRENYSKYASHELNFFLSRRDEAFFNAVVKPYLANKRDRTFLDDYLLGENLERYLQLYEFNRLNIVEKLLLARRLGGDVETRVKRHVTDAFALLPPQPGEDDELFETALRSRALEQDLEELEMLRAVKDQPATEAVALALDGTDRRGGAMGGGGAGGLISGNMAKKNGHPAAEAAPAPPMPAPMAAPKPALRAADKLAESMEEKPQSGLGAFSISGIVTDPQFQEVLRAVTLPLYRKLEETKVWAENNYYHVPIEEQVSAHIAVNAFWRDYAAWNGQGSFYSANFTQASHNLSEMIYAISLVGFPETAQAHEIKVENGVLRITAASPAIVFHQEVLPVQAKENPAPVLVSQNFFDPADRFIEENGERSDKFVTAEFLPGKTYGCQIVVTNPTSSRQTLQLFTQLPEKSLPVAGARVTHSQTLVVEPFSTQQSEYYFYFPRAEGRLPQYPVQLLQNEQRVAGGTPFVFNVVDKLSNLDTASWAYISQWGTTEQVLAFLQNNNLGRIDLSRIAWRVRTDAALYDRIVTLLTGRGVYDSTLWSYGVHHNRAAAIREFLLAQETFLDQAGLALSGSLVTSDPVQRHRYQQLEYAPLVNARAHQLGARRKIMNDDLWGQYGQFLKVVGYEPKPTAEQRLAASYYLFLQDRVDEGLAQFASVEDNQIREQVQHDYLACYAAFYQGDVAKARQVAGSYADYPVNKWRERFANVTSQLNEVDKAAVEVHNDQNRNQAQEKLADTEAAFELKVENREIRIEYKNLKSLTLNFYQMDLEFLFSSDPFVSSESGRFSVVRPNSTQAVALPENATVHTIPLPEEYRSSNVLVEGLGGGRKKSQAYYANGLKVDLVEDYGRLQAALATDGKPLAAAYVKVYAKFNDGTVQFYKDGYTDLRGKFDYASLNTDEIQRVTQFAILVSHDQHGSLVREVAPPNR